LSFYHLPLPGEDMNLLHFPDFYKIGIVISIFIGLSRVYNRICY